MRQNIICKCCGSIGHKAESCIIHGPKFLPPSLRINMNQFNTLCGDEPTDPPIEWNSQPPEYHFKFRIYPTKTSLLVSDLTWRLNHHAMYNGDVEAFRL